MPEITKVYELSQSCRDYMETNYGAYLTEEELNNAVTTLESLCE